MLKSIGEAKLTDENAIYFIVIGERMTVLLIAFGMFISIILMNDLRHTC